MSHGHGHGVPWCDLDVHYTTDKIPPGWHVGCGWRLDKYIEACEDWKLLGGYDENEKGMVVALRNRLKGTVREISDANRDPPRDPETSVPLPLYNTAWKNFFQVIKDNFKDDKQKNSERGYEEFLQPVLPPARQDGSGIHGGIQPPLGPGEGGEVRHGRHRTRMVVLTPRPLH